MKKREAEEKRKECHRLREESGEHAIQASELEDRACVLKQQASEAEAKAN